MDLPSSCNLIFRNINNFSKILKEYNGICNVYDQKSTQNGLSKQVKISTKLKTSKFDLQIRKNIKFGKRPSNVRRNNSNCL